MKKTLMAVAVLGAFAGSAMAADVTLYGVVDEGLVYTHSKVSGQDATDKLALDAGKQAGNRFGLKGVEDLGNGVKVGFVLENGFSADDGTFSAYGNGKEKDRLFGREATIFVESEFGKLLAGRMGQLTSGNGPVGIAGAMSPFGTSSYGLSQMYSVMVGGDRLDNTVAYVTPSFAGLKVYAQASLKNDSNAKYTNAEGKAASADEGSADTDRYYALGATYANAGLKLAFVVDMYDYGLESNPIGKDYDDGYTVTLGGSYDFEVVKAYLGAQYYDNIVKRDNGFGFATTDLGGQAKGYGITAGVDVPVLGGTFKFGGAYGDAENVDDSDKTFTRYSVDVGYVYPFSKRTSLYATAGYRHDKNEVSDTTKKTDTYQAVLGLTHKF